MTHPHIEVAGGWPERRRDGWVTLTVYAVIMFAAILWAYAMGLSENARATVEAYDVASVWRDAYHMRTDQLAGQLGISRQGVVACLVTHNDRGTP